jgi:hypothetical protein
MATAAKAGQRERLDDIEKTLEELRRRYELYFQGSPEQRTPPSTNKEKLGGELRRIREEETKTWNTVDKFRFSQIFARYVSMDRMWARTMKQIEDGTHKRDKLKVSLKKKNEAEAAASDTQVGNRPAGAEVPGSIDGLDVDVGSFDDENMINSQPSQKPVVPRPVATGPARPVAASTNGGAGGPMTDARLKQLYDVYMQAKKRTGEQSSLTMDGLRKQIEKQIPAIKAKHKCETVDFKVVLKDGKAMLKAVPK